MKCAFFPPIDPLFVIIFLPVVPKASRIVYSTCSVHATENERVVCAALLSEEAVAGPFHLASKQDVLPKWHRRGMPNEMAVPGKFYSFLTAYRDILANLRDAQRMRRLSSVVPRERTQRTDFSCLALCGKKPQLRQRTNEKQRR
jgi:hypothetical protein